MLDIKKIEEAVGTDSKDPRDLIQEGELNKILEMSIVDQNKVYAKETFILKAYEDNMREVGLCSLGNISTTIGAAKSRKTFFSTMIVSAMVSDKPEFGMKGNLMGKNILFIDTEQAKFHVQRLQKRITEVTGTNKNYVFLSLRHCKDMDTRLAFIDWYLYKYHKEYAFVIIDGVVDIVNDFNNQAECRSVVSHIMSWSAIYNLHINSVIHTNKDKGSARGHLGAELINKSEVAFRVKKLESNLTDISCEASRNKEFSSFEFKVENGLPVRNLYPIGYYDNNVPVEKELNIKNISDESEPNKEFENEDEAPF